MLAFNYLITLSQLLFVARFEEALGGVVGLASCEPMSQKRDAGHPQCGDG
jgi:hypothetical protein